MLAKTLIKISRKDLEVSEELYKLKYYSQSYFYFQQATEKANKALGLISGIISEKDCLDLKHDQLKIYRKSVIEQKNKLEKYFENINCFENVKPFPEFKNVKPNNYYQKLTDQLGFIDSVWNMDLMSLQTTDLNYLLKQLGEIHEWDIKFPKDIDSKMQSMFKNIIVWIDSFPTAEAKKVTEEIENYINDKSQKKEFLKVLNQYLKLIKEISIIEHTLYFCALLTIQHSSKTRYPIDGPLDNPLISYNIKLPIIKKQPEFSEYLKEAQIKLEKLINNSPAKSNLN